MPFTTIIPVSIIHKDNLFTSKIFYSANDVIGYKADLIDLMEDIVTFYHCEDDIELQKLLMRILTNALTRVLRFWLDEVFKPLSLTEAIPQSSRCYCEMRTRKLKTCLHDIIVFSHYDENGGKFKVDMFTGPPSMSVNVAVQDDRDIIKFRAYYANLLKVFASKPCCSCCPLSKDLMCNIEQLITATTQTLSDVDDYDLPSVTI